jgi:hypothetical protein
MIFGPYSCGIYNQNCHCQCKIILNSAVRTKNQEFTFEVKKISKTQSSITTTTILTENTSTTQKISKTDNKLTTGGQLSTFKTEDKSWNYENNVIGQTLYNNNFNSLTRRPHFVNDTVPLHYHIILTWNQKGSDLDFYVKDSNGEENQYII